MNLTLTRKQYRSDGIFSDLLTDEGPVLLAQTLEHSYSQGGSSTDPSPTEYFPKILKGKYQCIRSLHRLHGMDHDFETFEVTGIEGHEGLLFHWGNFNKDSEGCILVGERIVRSEDQTQMITNSRQAFERFMRLQEKVEEFMLTVD